MAQESHEEEEEEASADKRQKEFTAIFGAGERRCTSIDGCHHLVSQIEPAVPNDMSTTETQF